MYVLRLRIQTALSIIAKIRESAMPDKATLQLNFFLYPATNLC
jgi:hypothetical protein